MPGAAIRRRRRDGQSLLTQSPERALLDRKSRSRIALSAVLLARPESHREGDIVEDRLHESAVQSRTGVERRDEDTGFIGDWTEARIALGACVERTPAEGKVVDAVERALADKGR